MATGIKVTKVFADSCRVIANNYHKDESSVNIEKNVWSAKTRDTVVVTKIYCCFCGKLFYDIENFSKAHGGE